MIKRFESYVGGVIDYLISDYLLMLSICNHSCSELVNHVNLTCSLEAKSQNSIIFVSIFN